MRKSQDVLPILSSNPNTKYSCVDGKNNTFCYSSPEKYPWLALHLPEAAIVRVTIVNRKDCCGERAKNLEVWVSDTLPTTTETRFTDGQMLGSFEGPGRNGQVIDLVASQEISGSFVVIQTYPNGEQGNYLNLAEVSVFTTILPGNVRFSSCRKLSTIKQMQCLGFFNTH